MTALSKSDSSVAGIFLVHTRQQPLVPLRAQNMGGNSRKSDTCLHRVFFSRTTDISTENIVSELTLNH